MAKQTQHVAINAHEKCIACWKCIPACPKNVLGKVNILGLHKHAIFKHPQDCIGCGKCIKACPEGAYRKIEK